MSNARIILTRGIQGSGKTTWAKDFVKRNPDSVRINRDDIRQQLYGELWGGNIDEDLVTEVETSMARAALRAGMQVVVDATHLYQRFVNRWQRLGYPVKVVEFAAPLITLIENNSNREKQVPNMVIRKNFEKFTTSVFGDLVPVTTNPEFYISSEFPKYTGNPDDSPAFIVDIDGTLAHMDGRSPFDYSQVHTDTVDDSVRQVVESLEQTDYILIVSGRTDDCRAETEKWLKDNFIRYDGLFMRKRGDNRPDSIVKYEILMNDIAPRFNVMGVFDDRPSVCEMWRNVGVKTFQVGDPDNRF